MVFYSDVFSGFASGFIETGDLLGSLVFFRGVFFIRCVLSVGFYVYEFLRIL